jgi:L-ribulose-5-phosphate 4-epimerase
MVVVSLVDGGVSEGELKPSSDTPTHLELYRAFPGIAGVVHTHSLYATAWAQARRDLLPFGTTHADYFHGPVPCTRPLTDEEVQSEYEANAGKVIAEKFQRLDPMRISAALVANHGPFTWGVSPEAAVEAAVMLEHLARLAILTTTIEPYPKAISRTILDKHYHRKHGPGAYYGQGGQKS